MPSIERAVKQPRDAVLREIPPSLKSGDSKLLLKSRIFALQTFTAGCWWGEVCYGGNDDGTFTYPEIMVGADSQYTADNLTWCSSCNPFLYDSDLLFQVPDSNGMVSLYVDDSHEPTHHPGSGVAIDRVALLVGAVANPPAIISLRNIQATFYRQNQAPYDAPFAAQGPTVNTITTPGVTTASMLIAGPGAAIGVKVSAQVYMYVNGCTNYPPPDGLWARIEAIRT